MTTPSDSDLYRDPHLAQFYDLANRRRADFDYCLALASDAGSVLDLGCGTGELAATLAKDRAVTGVDPAAAMLDIARRRPSGDRVTWVQADARSVRLGRRFDLVLLTGHAFQVFLTDEDQRTALSTIAAHLAPKSRFIFDSRNPANGVQENRSRHDTVRSLEHPQLGRIEAWNESSYDRDTSILTYENGYRILSTGETRSASAQIRYSPQEDLAAKLVSAGLTVETWLGDWHGDPFDTAAKDIIPTGHLA